MKDSSTIFYTQDEKKYRRQKAYLNTKNTSFRKKRTLTDLWQWY
jgi:hypothetical protein